MSNITSDKLAELIEAYGQAQYTLGIKTFSGQHPSFTNDERADVSRTELNLEFAIRDLERENLVLQDLVKKLRVESEYREKLVTVNLAGLSGFDVVNTKAGWVFTPRFPPAEPPT